MDQDEEAMSESQTKSTEEAQSIRHCQEYHKGRQHSTKVGRLTENRMEPPRQTVPRGRQELPQR